MSTDIPKTFPLPQRPLDLVDGMVGHWHSRVVWVAPSSHERRRLLLELRAQLDEAGWPHGGQVALANGLEAYRHPAGGEIRFVTPQQSLRGWVADVIVDDTPIPRGWPAAFLSDVDVLRAAGAELIRPDRG